MYDIKISVFDATNWSLWHYKLIIYMYGILDLLDTCSTNAQAEAVFIVMCGPSMNELWAT